MALCEPLDCHCLDCNSILKSSHGLCCDKHINAEEKGSICLQKLTTVTGEKFCEEVKGRWEEERATSEMPLSDGEYPPSTLQDSLGLPVQQGLTVPQDKKCLKPDTWQPEQHQNTNRAGAAVPALDTCTSPGAHGWSLAKPVRERREEG